MFTKEYQDLGVKAPVWQPVDECVKKAQASLPMRDIRVVMDCPDIEVFADPLLEKVFNNESVGTRLVAAEAQRA